MSKTIKLAILISHPIQHFAPWHREVAKIAGIDLRVFFYTDWGVKSYEDPDFAIPVKWDVPLTEGYAHEFLPFASRPRKLNFWEVDNSGVADALAKFTPDVIQLFGYAYRSNWRVASWANLHKKPLLLFSDSNAKAEVAWWKGGAKRAIVSRFYKQIDGALYIGDNNLAYHKMYGLPEDRLFPCVIPIDRNRLLESIGDSQQVRRHIRAKHRIPQDAFLIVWCGKYIQRKSPLDMISAAHTAKQQGLPVWAVLVGEGPERPNLEEFCREHGVTNVVLTGFINQAEIASYYAAADVVAVTSEFDPHPLVVTEGAAFGLPVIISDRAGCIGENDVAKPDVNALVYPWGNREKLQEAIETLYKNQDLYKKMAAASEQIAKSQDAACAAQQLAEATHKLYNLGPRNRQKGGKSTSG